MTTNLDAGLTELNQALRMFTRHRAGADVALVFYAGHGLEVDGVNYVDPIAGLERRLHHLQGDARLALCAVRESVLQHNREERTA